MEFFVRPITYSYYNLDSLMTGWVSLEYARKMGNPVDPLQALIEGTWKFYLFNDALLLSSEY